MATARLLLVTGAVAMLSAVPVFAQTNTQTGSTGANDSTVSTPDGTVPNNAGSSGGSMNTTPRHNMGGGMHSSATHMSGQHPGMSSHSRMHAGRSDESQNGAVDRLNEQSYQAAQRGQNFTGGSGSGPGMSGGSDMSNSPSGSGMSGGSMGSGSGGRM